MQAGFSMIWIFWTCCCFWRRLWWLMTLLWSWRCQKTMSNFMLLENPFSNHLHWCISNNSYLGFVKQLQLPLTNSKKSFTAWQDAVRKDKKSAFGVRRHPQAAACFQVFSQQFAARNWLCWHVWSYPMCISDILGWKCVYCLKPKTQFWWCCIISMNSNVYPWRTSFVLWRIPVVLIMMIRKPGEGIIVQIVGVANSNSNEFVLVRTIKCGLNGKKYKFACLYTIVLHFFN